MIEEAPRLAEEISRRQREELFSEPIRRQPTDASLALRDKRWGDEESGRRRPVRLRKATAGRPDHFFGAGDCAGSGSDLAAERACIFKMAERTRRCLRRAI